MVVSDQLKKKAKEEGFLPNRDGIHFSGRVITENGVLNHKQLKNIAEAAALYGDGKVAFTSRMTVEIMGIQYQDIENIKAYLAKEEMIIGGTGKRVRPVVACKGTVCTYGLIDTQALATEIHKKFYEGYGQVTLPHKFKIAVGGCPNNCVKPDLNDIGIVGYKPPKYHKDLCKGCKSCGVVAQCAMEAADLEDGKMRIDENKCNGCGHCVSRCYFHALSEGTPSYRIYLGGRWGKKVRMGSLLNKCFSREEVMQTIEKAIQLYQEAGQPLERFGVMIDRLGLEKVENYCKL